MDRQSKRGGNDWGLIFDLIASEYGYTWSEFTELTYKQLNACLESIARRTHNDYAFIANIHGVEMDYYQKIEPPSKAILEKARKRTEEILRKKQQKIKNG